MLSENDADTADPVQLLVNNDLLNVVNGDNTTDNIIAGQRRFCRPFFDLRWILCGSYVMQIVPVTSNKSLLVIQILL